jgi:cell division initiation protein
MRLNHLDILEQCFRKKFRGYNKEEVDAFMHLVSEDFKEMAEDIQQLREELEAKNKTIRELERDGGKRLAASLTPDAFKEKARQIIESAKHEAEQHKQNAERELNHLYQEIKKMKLEKSDLIESIKKTIRDRLGQFKK